MKRLFKAADLDTYLEGNESNLHSPDFYTLLKQACEKRNMLPAQVIERSQIERTYGHQLFNGTRRPSRDKVLQLALGLGLSVDETQRLLRAAGKSPLYPRLKRDAVILYGIGKHLPDARPRQVQPLLDAALQPGDERIEHLGARVALIDREVQRRQIPARGAFAAPDGTRDKDRTHGSVG